MHISTNRVCADGYRHIEVELTSLEICKPTAVLTNTLINKDRSIVRILSCDRRKQDGLEFLHVIAI